MTPTREQDNGGLLRRLDEHGWSTPVESAMWEALRAGMPPTVGELIKEVCVLCDEAAIALRALEDEIDEVDGMCNRLAERNTALQSELDKVREALKQARDMLMNSGMTQCALAIDTTLGERG